MRMNFYFMLEMCFEDWEECFTNQLPGHGRFSGWFDTSGEQRLKRLKRHSTRGMENNPSSEEDPTLEFPIEVTDEEGNVISVANEDELDELFDECYGDEDDEYEFCFDLVFPITVELPDGTSQVANDYEELDEIIFTWFENNPSSEEFPTFTFPIEVDFGDGDVVTVNNEEELEEALRRV